MPDLERSSSTFIASNRQLETIDQELLEALRKGDENKIKELAYQNPELFNVRTPQGNTVLHMASRFRSKETVVQEILKVQPSLLHGQNHKGETPMHIAAKVGEVGVVQLFLEFMDPAGKGTIEQINILGMEDNEGNTPLHNALRFDHISMVQKLVAREDAPVLQVNAAGKSPLSIAIDSRLTDITWGIISKFPDDAEPEFFHGAILRGTFDLVDKLLKEKKEVVNMPDMQHRNSLHYAAASGYVEIVKSLLTEKASLANQGGRDGRTPLHYAAASGHAEIAKLLLKAKASLAYEGDRNGQTPLHLAVKNGRRDVLETILSYCPDAIDVLDNKHHNILHLAAQYGKCDIASFILEFPGIEDLMNLPDEDGNTPLHLAYIFSHCDVAEILSGNPKVNIRATNHKKQTPLELKGKSSTDPGQNLQQVYTTDPGKNLQQEMMTDLMRAASSKILDSKRDDSYKELITAIQRGDIFKICDLEKQNEKNLFTRTSPKGNTPLHIAARYGNWVVLYRMLNYYEEKRSSMVDKKNNKGETPLHVAAKYGNAVSVSLLVFRYERLLLQLDEEGNTPLHTAIRHGNEISAQILIRGNQDPQKKNKAGQSLLALAINGRLNHIARILIWKDALSFDHEGPEQLTLLHSAVINQDYDIMVEILNVNKELITKLDAKGRNPLHYAAASGHVKMARCLSQYKASLVYQSDNNDQTPLHLAAKNGQTNVLKMLLKHYPDAIELIDKNGRNILHIAAQNGNVKIVSFVLKLREMVDLVNSRDKNGNTPLHLATNKLQSDVVLILSRYINVNIRETNNKGDTALRIVETSAVKGKDIEKHLTIKALEAAYADRGLDVEDRKAQDEENRQERKDAEDIEGESGKGKEMAQTLSVMNTLIATFTFTAAFTIPGGFRGSGDADEGMVVLGKRTSFQAFVITDTIAMTSSMTAAVIVFWSFWCSKRESFMDSLPMAITLTWTGLVSMILAFVTGLYAVLSDNMALAITVSSISCTLPLIFYVFAPFISLLSNPSANVNPFAFTFSMAKIFLKKLTSWCFIRLPKINKGIKYTVYNYVYVYVMLMLLILVGAIYYLTKAYLIALSDKCKACLVTLSDWCFRHKSKENESNDQTPADPSNGRIRRKSRRNESNDQPPTDPQTNV